MEHEEKKTKAQLRLSINQSLLAITFTVFALTISLKPSLLKESLFVPTQLTVAIPLLFSSLFARSKLPFAKHPRMWEEYGYFTFLIGYSFLINVLGTLLTVSIGKPSGIIFFVANILISVAYSCLEIAEDRSKLFSRIRKDLFFATILFLGGILPSFILLKK